MLKRNTELRGDRPEVRMITDDQRNIAAQLPSPVPQQQIVQAVVVARYQDGDSFHIPFISDAPMHFEARGQLAHRSFERLTVRVKIRQIKANALEKLVGYRIGVLIGVENVRAVTVKNLGQSGNNPAPVLARNQKSCDVMSRLVR